MYALSLYENTGMAASVNKIIL